MGQPTDRNRADQDRRNIFELGGLLDDDGISRRKLLQLGAIGAGALSLPGILAACGGGDGTTSGGGGGGETSESPELKKLLDNIESKQVIIGNYGGDTEEVRKKVFWEPFEARTGVQVISADAGALAVPMLLGEIPTKWDAVHGSLVESYSAQLYGKKKLPMTPKTAWEDLILPKKFQPYIWQSFFLAYVPAALEGTFDTEPSSWADFFDTKKFPGKRAWPASYFTGPQLEAALFADGVDASEMYPLDLERGQRKIESIANDLVIYTEYPQAQAFLTSKTVSMSFAPNGLFHELEEKGVAVSVAWEVTPILEANGMNIMPEPPNEDAVMALAGFCNQPKLQAEFATMTNYGPPTKEAFEELTEEQVEKLPNAPNRTNVFHTDAVYFAENYSQIEKTIAAGLGE